MASVCLIICAHNAYHLPFTVNLYGHSLTRLQLSHSQRTTKPSLDKRTKALLKVQCTLLVCFLRSPSLHQCHPDVTLCVLVPGSCSRLFTLWFTHSFLLLSSSLSPFSIADNHSNANHQDETETTEGKERATETTNRNSPLDPISRPSVAPSRGPKLLPNQSRRQSKLDEPFPVGGGPQAPTGQPMPPMEARNDQSGLLNQAKAKAPGNQPSSMDDILGGLITLMGGNMKPPLGSAQSNGNADKFANFFSNLGVKPRQQHNGAQMGPPRGPPIPPFGSLPNMNHAHMQNRPPIGVGGGQFQMPPGNQFQMYPNFAFMPLMSGGSGGRPVIPLNGAGGGMPPKLPPNLPPLNGMTKAEMDALYAQFMANNGGSSGPDKAALLATLMKLAANKPFPPGLQLPPGLLAPSKPPVIHSSKENSESSHSSGTQPTPSMDKMHPMTEPPTGGRSKVSSTLTEEPQIITMAEEPSTFEMVVKHKIGPSINSANSATVLPMAPSSMSDSPQHIRSSKPLESSKATVHFQTNPQDVVVQEIRNQHGQHIQPLSAKEQPSNSMLPKNDIVYGKRIVKPTGNSQQQSSTSTSVASTIMPSFSSSHVAPSRTANEFSPSLSKAPIRPTSTAIGRPMVMPVEVDDGVKPKVGNGRGRDPHPTASVEPTRTIDGTRGVANSKSAYPAGKPSGSFTQSASPSNSPKSGGSNSNSKANREPSASSSAKPYVRRPQFRPRPNVPIVRIDTCIVGDDSTCDISLNEKCLTELGLSSCQCRPGFARIQPRTLCIPVLSLSISFRADKMNGNKVQFTRQLLNANTEEYQYLEYESIIALNSMFAATKNLGSELMGVKVNRFSMTGGKTIVNATVHLRAESNDTSVPSIVHPSTIKRTLQQELMSVIASTNNQLGDSNLWVDSTSNAITRIDDLNECSNVDTNDCSKHARCFNEFGSFRCECELGYEDKYADDKHKSGRSCSSCSPAFCGNRGECLITNGDKTCKCRANFFGPQCEYDIELLSVAIGGSIAALIIIAITITCLYLWK